MACGLDKFKDVLMTFIKYKNDETRFLDSSGIRVGILIDIGNILTQNVYVHLKDMEKREYGKSLCMW